MNYRRFVGAAIAALLIVIAILILPPGIWAASKYKELHKFKGKDGARPQAGLVFDSAWNLYGTTRTGGNLTACFYPEPGCGVVFKLTPNADGSWTERVIHKFNGRSDGGYPTAGLTFDGSGNLYGTTSAGGNASHGTVFKLTPNANGGWKESVLYSFKEEKDGHIPLAGVVFDAAGNLYGTTHTNGPYYGGDIFELTPNADGSWTHSIVWGFADYRGGTAPYGGVVFDTAGNLYATTSRGAGTGGAVFELSPNGDWNIPHTFKGLNDGKSPRAGLILDAAGNLYGTTPEGGNHNFCDGYGCGTVFELSPNGDGSWASSVLYAFRGKPSQYPTSGLVLDQAGNLCGTTEECSGTNCKGVVFEITP